MATKIWKAGAAAVGQLNTITPTAANAQTYTITVNGKSVTYLSDASATVAEITAGLVAAVGASAEPEFATDLIATDLGTALTLASANAGTPFTQTSSATGGGALVTVVTTAASGPNDWSAAANWSPSGVPVSTDDVVFDGTGNVDCLYGLDQHLVTLNSFTVTGEYTASIGLPARNAAGYTEYRDQYLRVSATTVSIGADGQGPTLLRLNVGSNQTTAVVYGSGPDTDAGPAVQLLGTHASNALTVEGGSAGAALFAGEAATLATLRTSGDGSFVGGAGLTLAAVQIEDGRVALVNGATGNVKQRGGSLFVTGGGLAGVTEVFGGTLDWRTTGTLANLKVSLDGVADFRADPRAHTVTAATFFAGATVEDPFGTVNWSYVLNGCRLKDVNLDLGTHLTCTSAPGP